MPEQVRTKESPKHYARISLKRRQNLVDLVLQKSYSIGRAAARLKIKLSTAKMIVKKYRDHGTFFEKKSLPKRNIEPRVLASSLEPQKQTSASQQDSESAVVPQQPSCEGEPEEKGSEEKAEAMAGEGFPPSLIFWNAGGVPGYMPWANFMFPFGNGWHWPAFL